MMELMLANMDPFQARMGAGHEEMMAKLDAHHEMKMACLKKTEATDFEANLEDMESGAEHREVPEEHAAVETGRGPNKKYWGRHLATTLSRVEGTDPGKLWKLEEIGHCLQRKDPPCRSTTAQGTRRQGESN
jgi:hypothetical protein